VQVTVVEKHGRVGGRTATMEQDGFKFDIGPTFFLYPRVLREIFRDAGYDLDREVPMSGWIRSTGWCSATAAARLTRPPDVERMERQIAAISPGMRGVQELPDRNREKLAVSAGAGERRLRAGATCCGRR
jgi:phytoene desaturase